MKKRIFGMLVISVFIWSCSKTNTSPSYTPDCTGAAKSFSSDVRPLIQSSCSGCHSNFSGYSQISGSKASIRSRIVSGSMPQGGSLSDAQKNIIVCWIDNGAPNN